MTGERKRKPWLAGLLQFITAGLGNLYCGRPRRALSIYLLVRGGTLASVLAMLWLSGLWIIVLFVGIVLSLFVFAIYDGIQCARAANPGYRLAAYNRWYVYVLLVIGIAIVDEVLIKDLIRAHLFEAFSMPSPSMQPTIVVGDNVVTDKTAYLFSQPYRGEVVIYHPPDLSMQIWVDRIVGLPGETIEIRNGVVLINDKELTEPYVRFDSAPSALEDTFGPYSIPNDTYFLLGDNRQNSMDSRHRGAIERTQLLGKVKTVYFSWDSENGHVRWKRLGKRID